MAENPVIACPSCHKKFKGKSDLSGKRIKCPFCATPFQVPNAQIPVAAAHTPPPIPEARANPFDDEEDDKNPYGVSDVDIAPRCPNCAQLMESSKAFICKFCGYNTLTRELGKTVKVVSHTFGERFVYLLPAMLGFVFIVLQTVAMIFYCVIVPTWAVPDSWWAYADAESLRLWLVSFSLFDIWPVGIFIFKRFVLNPTPPDKVLE